MIAVALARISGLADAPTIPGARVRLGGARSRLTLLAATLAVAAAVGSAPSGASARAASNRGVTSTVRAQLRKKFLAYAKFSGDAHPTEMRVVVTNSDAGSRLIAPGDSSNQSSARAYVLCARGRFVWNGPQPPGTTSHPEPVLCWVVAARGLGVLTITLGPRYPDLQTLGSVRPR